MLERYLSRLNASGLKSLSGRELLDLGRAWRRCGALLSRARSAGLEGPNIEALNRLLARVYPLVQRPVERRSSSAFDLIARGFPRAVRREVRVIALATIVLLIGALVGAAVAALNHDMTDVVLGSGWADALDKVATRHVGDADWMPVETRPFESARIMTNNLRVAITAFGLGVILCLGSFWVLYFNGLMLGAVAIVVHQRGVDAPFWGFVAPHGATEIPAIILSAAAGIIVGHAFIAPGRASRSSSLIAASKRAVPLVMGVALLLVEAGIVEGFVSPRVDLSPATKMTLGLLIFSALIGWLSTAGQDSDEAITSVPPPSRHSIG